MLPKPQQVRRPGSDKGHAYLDLCRTSNGACRFALVTSLGAERASWYLVCAKAAAAVFATLDFTAPGSPRICNGQCSAHVDALKEMNRSDFVESYVLVHTLRTLVRDAAVRLGYSPDFVTDYVDRIEAASPDAALLCDISHRPFIWEQQRVVSRTLDKAFARFGWPLMRSLCQRPWVWFSYFDVGPWLNFQSFTDEAERIEKGPDRL